MSTEYRAAQRRTESLQFERVSPLIAERISAQLAQRPNIMPRGWIMSYAPDQATVEDLMAAEWDEGVERYSAALREMGGQAEAVWNAVPHIPENAVAVFVAKQAVMNEADAYFDPHRGRPGAALFWMLHWYEQLKTALKVADNPKFSAEDKQRIIRGRMSVLKHELRYLLSMVKIGGWLSAEEKEKFCNILNGTALDDTKAKVLEHWTASQGIVENLDADWEELTRTVAEYSAAFQAVEPPTEAKPLGVERVKQYLESTGIMDEPRELIERCDVEASVLRVEIERIKSAYPEATLETLPLSDDDILARGTECTEYYQTQFVDSGLIPKGGLDIRGVVWVTRPSGQNNELSSMNLEESGMMISVISAEATEGWARLWPIFAQRAAHELTHHVQRKSDSPVKRGWLTRAAREGAAVAMEWMSLATERISPATMLCYLEAELRLVMRTKLGLQFHTGELHSDDVAGAVGVAFDGENEYMRTNAIAAIKTDFVINTAYWIGAGLIAALTKQQHDGNLPEAMRELAHAGFRLPGHVFIQDADPTRFHLITAMPETPISVQIARRRFPNTAAAWN
ncbi:MAG: hypothetical protein KIH62_004145 [Candidatus Kerfeldbacteria bacterium]|nr:hypothetical protein [Candidatus Kerfeldbacteria bacterium]